MAKKFGRQFQLRQAPGSWPGQRPTRMLQSVITSTYPAPAVGQPSHHARVYLLCHISQTNQAEKEFQIWTINLRLMTETKSQLSTIRIKSHHVHVSNLVPSRLSIEFNWCRLQSRRTGVREVSLCQHQSSGHNFTTNPPHCPLTGTAPASMCSRIVDVVHPTPGAKVVMQSYFLLVVMLELTVEQSTPQPIV